MRINKLLVFSGVLSLIASLIHVGIVIGGPPWYRFFGAGEEMATLAQEGSPYPMLITLGIAALLFIWACYAFSGAGLIRRLPFTRLALILISAIFLVRGAGPFLAVFFSADILDQFMVWSSLIVLIYGASYAFGTYQEWENLSH